MQFLMIMNRNQDSKKKCWTHSLVDRCTKQSHRKHEIPHKKPIRVRFHHRFYVISGCHRPPVLQGGWGSGNVLCMLNMFTNFVYCSK